MRARRAALTVLRPRTWFLALILAAAAFAFLNRPTQEGVYVVRLASWPTSSSAYAASTAYYMDMAGIPGSSTAAGYSGQIEVASWQFGDTKPVPTIGGPPTHPACSAFKFRNVLDGHASPALFQKALSVGEISDVLLTGVRTDTPTPTAFLTVDLTHVLVTADAESSDGSTVVESVTLNYESVSVAYTPQNADGSFGAPETTGWNCATSTPTNPPPPTATSTTLSGSPAAPVYGGALSLTATVTPSNAGGSVSFSDGSTTLCSAATVSTGTAACSESGLSLGTHNLTATFTPSSGAFTGSSGTLAVTVGPAPLTITADNQTMTYGGPLPTLTASYSGFVNGDTPASLTAPPALSTAAATSHAGSYAINVSGAVDPNYTIAYVRGTLTIQPAPLTISADNQTMTYGGTLPALTASYSGFVNGDTVASLTTPPALSTVPATSHAGSYPINASGAVDPDYTITYAAGTLTILPAPLTISADNQTMTYGGPLPTLTATYNGLVNGDTPASLTAPPVLATVPVTSHVGTYAITVSGAVDPDYAITYQDGTLTVVPAPLTVKADDKSRSFGAANPPFTATYMGLVNGDTPASLSGAAVFSTPATITSQVGTYPITVSGLSSADYTITFLPGTLTINPAALQLTLAAVPRGEAEHEFFLEASVVPLSLAGQRLTGSWDLYMDGEPIAVGVALSPSGSVFRPVSLHDTANHVFKAVFNSSNHNFATTSQTLSFAAAPGEHGGQSFSRPGHPL